MQAVNFQDQADAALAALSRGAFLTTAHDGRHNVMTIGWGSIGFMWGKPVFTVLVRPSRFSYQLLDASGEFTVSIPQGDMQPALDHCGAKSGRDGDKFAAAGLSSLAAQQVAAPLIAGCRWYYECKVLYKQAMLPAALAAGMAGKWYPNGDYHTMYFGEIVAAHTK
jgi:flavin reductase (DIM6/NTAB) family NADH-FMN oxidoreductase RutF